MIELLKEFKKKHLTGITNGREVEDTFFGFTIFLFVVFMISCIFFSIVRDSFWLGILGAFGMVFKIVFAICAFILVMIFFGFVLFAVFGSKTNNK